jgi:D-glycero-alpha-D-manno-heptose-7-phosphate kinase
MSGDISNKLIDEIYEAAINSGAKGGKISGAGGGGFMFFYCPDNTKFNVIEKLNTYGGITRNIQFTEEGLTTWQK